MLHKIGDALVGPHKDGLRNAQILDDIRVSERAPKSGMATTKGSMRLQYLCPRPVLVQGAWLAFIPRGFLCPKILSNGMAQVCP